MHPHTDVRVTPAPRDAGLGAGLAVAAPDGADDRGSALAAHCALAARLTAAARARWGAERETVVVGEDAALIATLARAARFAAAAAPCLVTGETGSGKELFARAMYLLSARVRQPYLVVNCAQYHDGQLMASELFGHRRGAFTGATNDHRGVFEEAHGGVVFLDEVGELSLPAQAMLLRVLGEGEIVPVGTTQTRHVDVRVIAATSRELGPMVAGGRFRADLYYRLRHLHVRVPALRERGDDWQLVLQHYLDRLSARNGSRKLFSRHALGALRTYQWPGNVRELRSLVETGYCLSDGPTIEVEHIAGALEASALERAARDAQWERIVFPEASIPVADVRLPRADAGHGAAHDVYERLAHGDGTFWELVQRPYLARELSRAEVRRIIERGLVATRGSYKRLLAVFGMEAAEYLKFMDFLRHHDLKPPA